MFNRNKLSNEKLYSNSPIDDPKNDIFDFSIKASNIHKAIENGARMIALIGKYGSGKSSLTKLIYRNNFFHYSKPIYVNLWNCFYPKEKLDNPKEVVANNISQFSKSFLYQLVSTSTNKNFSRYINQRLSKNYGKLSLTYFRKSTLLFVLLAGVSFLNFFINKVPLINPIFFDNSLIKSILFRINDFFQILNAIPKEIHFFVGCFFIYMAIRKNNFLFSLWDSQGKIDIEEIDSYEIFKEIVTQITPIFRKQIIVVEDLDRTNNIDYVISVLKEIYKFSNLLTDKQKEKIVFIISLKSETELKKSEYLTAMGEEQNIYSKIFDYSVWIQPLHIDNVRNVFESLLPDFDNLNDLEYLMKGKQLTVREIKDRLNETFLIFNSLKNRTSEKDKQTSSIDLSKCACVTYLKRQYPEEYAELIKDERKFSEAIKTITFSTKTNEKEIKACISSLGITNEEFSKELVLMIKDKKLESDFKMYFYTYPINCSIVDIFDKEICENILNDGFIFSDNSILEEEKTIKLKTENLENTFIIDALKNLRNNKRTYGKYVLYFEDLYRFAEKENFEYTIYSIAEYVRKESSANIQEAYLILQRLASFNLEDRNKTIDSLSNQIVPIIDELYRNGNNEKLLQEFRHVIIKNFANEIISFNKLFIREIGVLPLIDLKDLKLISNSHDILHCIEFQKLTEKNIELYFEYLVKCDFSNEEKSHLYEHLLKIPSIENIPNIHLSLSPLVEKNKLFDENICQIIYNSGKKNNQMNNYVGCMNVISEETISISHLQNIDNLCTTKITNIKLLVRLEENGFYCSSLLSRLELNNFEQFDFNSEKLISSIDLISDKICSLSKKSFISLRKIFLDKIELSKIYGMYNAGYALITNEELQNISAPNLYYALDFSHIDQQHIEYLSNYANSKSLRGDNLYNFFKSLFFADKGNEKRITNESLIWAFLEQVDFKKCLYNSLKEKQKNRINSVLSPLLGLDSIINALRFMKLINCHIHELDQLIFDNVSFEDPLLEEYLNVCNAIQAVPEELLDFLNTIPLNHLLSDRITNKLLNRKMYTSYIIGTSLRINTITLSEYIPLENYYEAYKTSSKFFSLAKSNTKLIENFLSNQFYSETLSLERLEPYFRQERQPFGLIKLGMEKIPVLEDKKTYLRNIKHINTVEDASSFLDLILSDNYLHLFNQDNDFELCIKEKLWNASQKSTFTKKMNEAKKQGKIS